MATPTIPLRPIEATGFGDIVVTPHRLATGAGIATLARGGNAVDAAIAANAVQGVVAPETCGIGGDLFALIHLPGSTTPRALNASGRAGEGAQGVADDLRRAGVDEIPQRNPAAVTVPGCVDGWLALHGELGELDLETVLAPAVRLASTGFPANREMAAAFAARFDELAVEMTDMYPGGRPPHEGDVITRPRLAETLTAIAANGRAAFYSGEIGRGISEAVDGVITADDLDHNQATWIGPLSVDVFGTRAWTVPPNSQGYISLVALAILEALGGSEPSDGEAWHRMIESYRLAAADRDSVLADPESMEIPPDGLVSPDRIQALADRYSPGSAASLPAIRRGAGGTAYLAVVDADGMGVSVIQSNFYGIGSGLPVPAGGFYLHDRGRGFTLTPGHANELRPGRRPLHTLSPTIWTRGAELTAVIGTRGGHIQPQLVSQLSAWIMGGGLEPASAMALPRWTVPWPLTDEGSAVEVEPGTPEPIVDDLRSRGHSLHLHEIPQGGWGPMSAIRIEKNGLRRGAADPRVDTTAAAVL